jgi:hypothetical protein
MRTIVAYCWANGVIELGPRCIEGALPLVKGEARKVHDAIEILATHGYDGVTRIVPKSIAWCESDMNAAVDDVSRFAQRLEDYMAKEETVGAGAQ